ncbi:phytoene desaturase family protein [Ktedonosporobacter rubrisoli]|nr:FAD-dependent oxidoreductase [Ktedonosporobacter rubrisoli]
MHAQKFDAIVIGGGLAGLTAAAYLARAGREVALLEKSSLLGGRAITRNVQGFSFNLGAHALYLGGPAEQILHELGVAYSGKTPDLSRYMGAYESTIAQLPVSLKNTITSGLFTMREKLELARLFAVLARSDHTQLEGTSLQTWAEKNVERPRIREFLYMFSRLTTYTHAPELVDAAFVLNFWRTQPTVLYLDHGWQTLIEGLKRVAQGAGVQLMPNSRVVELEYAADQVSGVRLANDTILEAGAVILATEAEPALDLLGERKSASLRTWEQSRHQLYAAVLDLGLRRLPQPQHAYVLGIDRPFCSVAMSERARLAPRDRYCSIQFAIFIPLRLEMRGRSTRRWKSGLI